MKRVRWKTLLGFTGLAALLYYFVARGPSATTDAPPAQAPALSLPDLQGKMVALSDFKGKVVLLDFWATWCEPCLEELPDLKALHAQFSGSGFTIVGVSMDAQGKDVVAPFVRENAIAYPILLSEGELPSGFPIPGFPTAFLIDRRGRILRRYLGAKSFKELSKDVSEALAR